MPLAEWQKTIDVNLTGAFLASRRISSVLPGSRLFLPLTGLMPLYRRRIAPGSFLVVKSFLNQLKHVAPADLHKVAVVFIGSTAGLFGEAGHADYAATKSGLMAGFQLSLKNELVKLAPAGRVNAVNPGWTRTPAVAGVLENPDVVYAALASTPLKKLAEPEDIAHVVLGLASWRMSGHVTGQVRPPASLPSTGPLRAGNTPCLGSSLTRAPTLRAERHGPRRDGGPPAEQGRVDLVCSPPAHRWCFADRRHRRPLRGRCAAALLWVGVKRKASF